MSEKAAKKAPAKKQSVRKAPERKKRAAAEKASAQRAAKAVAEQTPAPAPFVLARHEYEMMERVARGYSHGELEAAGITVIVARKAGVRVDPKRRSVLEGNVSMLKGWYVPAPKKAKVEAEEKAEKPAKKKAKKPKKAVKAKKSE
jgi:ribosomal protein L13E